MHDLLAQSYELHLAHRALGARILLRSAFETLAILIHLNQITEQVLSGTLGFHLFSEKTTCLLLGSRDKTTTHESINITTVLEHAEKAYSGIKGLYAALSESAHPNFAGMCFGYARIDNENFVSEFSNNMCAMYEEEFVSAIELSMFVFEHEYNNVWPSLFAQLEDWLVANNQSDL